MIEIIPSLAENIVAVKASGQVTKEDYQTVFIPALKQAIEKQDKVKIYYQFGEDFTGIDPGAMWEDMWFGIGNMDHWEKVVIVTDVGWIKSSVSMFSFVMTCPVKVFSNSESSTAMAWLQNNSNE